MAVFGLSAPTSSPARNALAAAPGAGAGGCAATSGRGEDPASLSVPGVLARHDRTASHTSHAAPTTFTTVKALALATTTADSPADWGEREGGRSLAVEPTAWARAGGLAAQEGIWAAVIAQEPEADTNGMRDQLLCHALGAPDKETWNLEPWRPDVGSFATLAARCNPT